MGGCVGNKTQRDVNLLDRLSVISVEIGGRKGEDSSYKVALIKKAGLASGK